MYIPRNHLPSSVGVQFWMLPVAQIHFKLLLRSGKEIKCKNFVQRLLWYNIDCEILKVGIVCFSVNILMSKLILEPVICVLITAKVRNLNTWIQRLIHLKFQNENRHKVIPIMFYS